MLFSVWKIHHNLCEFCKEVRFFLLDRSSRKSTTCRRVDPQLQQRQKWRLWIPLHTDMVIARTNFSLQPCVFHCHRLRNAGCNIQRGCSAQKLPESERHSAFKQVFLALTCWKYGLEWGSRATDSKHTQSRKPHNLPSFVTKRSPSQLWPYWWTSC